MPSQQQQPLGAKRVVSSYALGEQRETIPTATSRQQQQWEGGAASPADRRFVQMSDVESPPRNGKIVDSNRKKPAKLSTSLENIAAFYHTPSAAQRAGGGNNNNAASLLSPTNSSASASTRRTSLATTSNTEANGNQSQRPMQRLLTLKGGGVSPSKQAPSSPTLTEADLSAKQIQRLQSLYDEYCRQVAEKGPLDWEVVAELLAKVDTTLIDKALQMARLRKCGFNPLKCPVMPFSVLVNYALRSPAMLEAPLPKDEQETVDAFVCLGGNRDRSGFITTETLRNILENFKIMLDVQALLNEVDTDGSGTIEYDEFEAFYLKRKKMSAEAAARHHDDHHSNTDAGTDGEGSEEEIEGSAADVITRTLSMTSVEAFNMLSKLLLNGDGEGDLEDEAWQIRGAYAERLQREKEIADDKYALDDVDEAIIDFNNVRSRNLMASPMTSGVRNGGDGGGGESPEATPQLLQTTPSSPNGASLQPLSLSFATGGGGGMSFASSVNFASPLGATASQRGGSATPSHLGVGRRARGATLKAREKTAAAILNDKLNAALEAHTKQLKDVTHKYNQSPNDAANGGGGGGAVPVLVCSDVEHVPEIAAMSVEKERRRSEAIGRQTQLFNDRVSQKRGGDFGVTPFSSGGGGGAPSGLAVKPPPAPPSSSFAPRPQTSSGVRKASLNTVFGAPPPPPRPMSANAATYQQQRRASLSACGKKKEVPHYAKPIASQTPSSKCGNGSADPTASLAALLEARKDEHSQIRKKEREIDRCVSRAEDQIESLNAKLHPSTSSSTAPRQDATHRNPSSSAHVSASYEAEIQEDDAHSTDEDAAGEGNGASDEHNPNHERSSTCGRPQFKELMSNTKAKSTAQSRPTSSAVVGTDKNASSRPVSATNYERFNFDRKQRPSTSLGASEGGGAPSSYNSRGNSRPTSATSLMYECRKVSAFAGRDFYTSFATSAPLSARRTAAAAAAASEALKKKDANERANRNECEEKKGTQATNGENNSSERRNSAPAKEAETDNPDEAVSKEDQQPEGRAAQNKTPTPPPTTQSSRRVSIDVVEGSHEHQHRKEETDLTSTSRPQSAKSRGSRPTSARLGRYSSHVVTKQPVESKGHSGEFLDSFAED